MGLTAHDTHPSLSGRACVSARSHELDGTDRILSAIIERWHFLGLVVQVYWYLLALMDPVAAFVCSIQKN
jgi:hypothetical protein